MWLHETKAGVFVIRHLRNKQIGELKAWPKAGSILWKFFQRKIKLWFCSFWKKQEKT